MHSEYKESPGLAGASGRKEHLEGTLGAPRLSESTNQARRIEVPMREARRSPPAHRSARVIGTDALRILLVSPEPSDGQEHKQDTKDDPNINAHQSSPAAGSYPRKARIA